MTPATKPITGLAILLSLVGLWAVSCSLNPQPEPPMDLGQAGTSAGPDASAAVDGNSHGGQAGSSTGYGGAGGAGGAGGTGYFADAQADVDCLSDDCKCGVGDAAPCDAGCEAGDGGDAACDSNGGCDASDSESGSDDAPPDSDPQDALSTD